MTKRQGKSRTIDIKAVLAEDEGGVPREILYDQMKTAVIGEDAEAHIVYNRALIEFAGHYRFHPRACRPYPTPSISRNRRSTSNTSRR
jgi:hypothetical protein